MVLLLGSPLAVRWQMTNVTLKSAWKFCCTYSEIRITAAVSPLDKITTAYLLWLLMLVLVIWIFGQRFLMKDGTYLLGPAREMLPDLAWYKMWI